MDEKTISKFIQLHSGPITSDKGAFKAEFYRLIAQSGVPHIMS